MSHSLTRRFSLSLFFSLLLIIIIAPVLLLPSLATGASAAGSTANWPQPGGNPQHTYYNSHETIISTSNMSQLMVKWQVPMDGSTPVVVNNVLYFLSFTDGNVYAFNSTSGAQLWHTFVGWGINPSQYFGSRVLIAKVDQTVYVSAGQALYALNATTGAIIWHASPTNQSSGYSPNELTVANGRVFFVPGGISSILYALNAQTGATLWTAGNDSAPVRLPVAFNNGILYSEGFNFPDETPTLIALKASTGAILWQTELNISGDVSFSPTMANGMVYLVAPWTNGAGDICLEVDVLALSATTGQLLWEVRNNGLNGLSGCQVSATSVANNALYIGSFGSFDDPNQTGSVTAYNATTGALIWSTPTSGVVATPVIANGVVYAGGASLFALDATTGQQIWTGISQQSDSPVVVNGKVFVVVGSTLTALHLPH